MRQAAGGRLQASSSRLHSAISRWPLAVAVVVFIALLSFPLGAQTVIKKDGKAEQFRVFGSNLVTLPSSSSLCQIQIMVRTGSADDAQGKEGTANLAARALIEGGFGDTKKPVTKEKLAEITRPWGDAALPKVLVEKEATTFSVTVPRDAFPQFVAQVLNPCSHSRSGCRPNSTGCGGKP